MIEQFQNLLSRFNEIIQEEELESEVIDIEEMKKLLQDFHPFVKKIEEQERIETPHYNLFQILNIKHLEAEVHTPFLANLLNPEGSHSQKKLFLDIFLKDILKLKTELFLNYEMDYLRVIEEHSFSNGRIDIFIDHRPPEKGKRFVIIIENKINAGDQNDQLKRYYDYAIHSLNLQDRQIKILYLNKNNKDASDKSIAVREKDKLKQNGVLINISYGREIRRWLSKCNESIQSGKLSQTINQYLEIINELSYEQDESEII